MSKEQKEVGVAVMRGQVPELHLMHAELIDTALARHDKVIIFIGTSPANLSIENPMDYKPREQMMLTLYPPHSHPGLTVTALADVEDDEEWSAKLDAEIRARYGSESVMLYGGRSSFASYYTGRFEVSNILEGVLSLDESSGTAVRAAVGKQAPINSSDFRKGMVYAAQKRYPTCYATVDIGILKPSVVSGGCLVLLGKKRDGKEWRLPGGFAEPGEGFKTSALREAREETGIVIPKGDIRHIDSFPIKDWRYGGRDRITTTLFSAEVGQDAVAKAGDDLAAVEWFGLTPELKLVVTKTHHVLIDALVEDWKARLGVRQRFEAATSVMGG
jgi:bifunctional NMN adenylyltransferase/nudix hydrolase